MMKRIVMIAAFVLLLAGVAGAGIGPDFLIRVDLSRRADFDRGTALGLEPVFRSGNEFYVVGDGSLLNRLSAAGLNVTVIDQDPFVSGYYYVDAKSPLSDGASLAKTGAQALDQIGGRTLYRSEQPLLFTARLGGDGPIPITGSKIPLVYTAPLSATGTAALNPIIDTIAARISMDSLVAYDTHLVNFQTRYAYAVPNAAAEAWLREKFLSFGYDNVTQDTFNVSPGFNLGHNIICTKTGSTEPNKVILIGAHFDSYNISTDPGAYAPGADDNASGTAGILEIARVLAQIPSNKTIIFVAFDAEEQWMVGSYYYASRAHLANTDIELMINMDMIGYNPSDSRYVFINTEQPSLGYAQLAARLAGRTSLHTSINPYSPASDQLPFDQLGYHFFFAEEYEFNTPGYHDDTDQLWRLNPPYWTDVVRMVAMTAFTTAQAPAPVISGVELWDVGDGHTLELRWALPAEANPAGYRVYWGTSSNTYTDSATVSPATSAYQIGNLIEGQMYYAAVFAIDSMGWESPSATEMNLVPLHAPRVPAGVTASSDFHRVILQWATAVELDLDHYVISRGTDSTLLTGYVPSVAGHSYADTGVVPHTRYYYQITAVDHAGNASGQSSIVSGIPASFDRGALVVDMTSATSGNPSEADQVNVYSTFFTSYNHWYKQSDDLLKFDHSELGEYKTVFILDDDYQWERWPASHWADLNWYLSYPTNLVVVGWTTPNEIRSAGLLGGMFKVSMVTRQSDADCAGGLGVAGFPDVAFDTSRVFSEWNGTLFNMWTMAPADPSAEVIMRYRSATGNTALETLPVGVRCLTGAGKAALIGLPLYYLRTGDAIALISALMDWFGTAPEIVLGDLNGDRVVNVLDVVAVIDAAFMGFTPPTGLTRADVNGDCLVDVNDVISLIDYTFAGGSAPLPGCAK